jgi:hypothetical protein
VIFWIPYFCFLRSAIRSQGWLEFLEPVWEQPYSWIVFVLLLFALLNLFTCIKFNWSKESPLPFCSTGVWTHSLAPGRQALYCLNHTENPGIPLFFPFFFLAALEALLPLEPLRQPWNSPFSRTHRATAWGSQQCVSGSWERGRRMKCGQSLAAEGKQESQQGHP